MGKKTHPIISVYGDTNSKQFPIILIVGREPNAEAEFINEIGEYDFDKAPRCGFWNTSYGVIGEIINEKLNCKKLKDECRKKGNSFIAYTDLSPEPIINAVPGNLKNKKRKDINLDQYEKHISNIFLHEDIIDRADLIIFSGLGNNNVQLKAVELFKNKLISKNKVFLEVPFFVGNNKRNIKEIIDKEHNKEKDIIRNIYKQWENNV